MLDPGSSTIRAGFAGEDTPKSVIPSHYGQRTDADSSAATTGLLFGDNTLHNPQPHGLEIKTPFNSEGVIDDWDVAGRLFEYSITSRLTGRTATPASKNGLNDGDADGDVKMGDDAADGEAQEAAAQEADREAAKAVEAAQESEKLLTEHPILMTEPAWNPTKNREKCMEIALEQWGAPAFFLSKTGGLTAYVLSRVDLMTILIGAGSRLESRLPWSSTSGRTRLPSRRYLTASYSKKVRLPRSYFPHRPSVSCSPYTGVQKSRLAGNFLSDQIRLQFSQMTPPVPLVPYYTVKSKSPVDAGAPANAVYHTFKQDPTTSFRKYQEDRVLTSFKESMVQVWSGPGALDVPANLEMAKAQPPRPFEMPDGWNQVFGIERYRVAEGLFSASAALKVRKRIRASPFPRVVSLFYAGTPVSQQFLLSLMQIC